MKRYSSAAGLALAGLAVLGLSGPVAAGDQVPFKGSLEGVVTITPINPPIVFVLVEGTGKAAHLGKLTVQIPHVVGRQPVGIRLDVLRRRGQQRQRRKEPRECDRAQLDT